MRKLVLIAAVTAASATPALAQPDAPFTGAHVEGMAGWDHAGRNGAGNNDGVAYGVGVGYDFQLGGAVAGDEGEAADATTDRCAGNVSVPGDELCFKAKRDLYAGARVGAVIGKQTLLYAKGGYTNARFGLDYDDGATGAGNFRTGRNLDGFRVGAGVERQLGTNTFAKAEYRYSNYQQGFDRHQVVAGVGVRF